MKKSKSDKQKTNNPWDLWLTRKEQGIILFLLALVLIGGTVYKIRDAQTSYHPINQKSQSN